MHVEMCLFNLKRHPRESDFHLHRPRPSHICQTQRQEIVDDPRLVAAHRQNAHLLNMTCRNSTQKRCRARSVAPSYLLKCNCISDTSCMAHVLFLQGHVPRIGIRSLQPLSLGLAKRCLVLACPLLLEQCVVRAARLKVPGWCSPIPYRAEVNGVLRHEKGQERHQRVQWHHKNDTDDVSLHRTHLLSHAINSQLVQIQGCTECPCTSAQRAESEHTLVPPWAKGLGCATSCCECTIPGTPAVYSVSSA